MCTLLLPPCDPFPITSTNATLATTLSPGSAPRLAPTSRIPLPHLPRIYLKFLLLGSLFKLLRLKKHNLIKLSHNLCEMYIHHSSGAISFTKHAFLKHFHFIFNFYWYIIYICIHIYRVPVCPFTWWILSYLSSCGSDFISKKPLLREYPDWARCLSHWLPWYPAHFFPLNLLRISCRILSVFIF